RWYTDTGPILERELASRAGLGWIGKNTCLINPEKGSYFFLAEILLGIELAPDPPFPTSQCGSCTRCIDACPTGSLKEPYTLDANRCISYLTIELKEAIPRDLRPLLGDWIFGCDICQQVCPWNGRSAPGAEIPAEFAFRAEVAVPVLGTELALSPQEFNSKFRRSPVKRTKRRGYLRNVAVALGNAGEEQAVPALATALGDEEPLVRGHAAWALGQIGGESARQTLKTSLGEEENPDVRAEIRAALERLS
ncbi:MAG: tRNA epoxyqueuosine(34) reductase QueG, partial [Chloroflexota bacterium]|nr:tRNA epoxyqueuosine(34) reductase QueG [Chloroflexota bacterium]